MSACDDIARQSGRSLSNCGTLLALADALAARAAARGERALLVAETSDPCPRLPPRLAAALGADAAAASDDGRADRADRLLARLGTERRRPVHDARVSLDPALFAAAAGTVPAGGVLALLLGQAGPSAFDARFRRRLRQCLDAMPTTGTRITLPDDASRVLQSADLVADPRSSLATGAPWTPPPEARAAQDAALGQALRHLLGRAARPAVLVIAPRGHGKSALLGRLAARLDAMSGADYAVTAARRSTLAVLERHRRAAHPAGGGKPRPLPFLPPEVALSRGGGTLLVDEAASLPLDRLAALLARYRSVVLATTVQGHESAGRGAALRLPSLLDRGRGGWLRLEPSTPMRWRAGDPLDGFVTETLLLDGARGTRLDEARGTRPETAPRDGPRTAVRAAEVDRDALARDERRLRAVFGLLVATHYRSTALDLRHLLDAPRLRLWAVEDGRRLLGVALVASEPGLASTLHEDILAHRRRPPHRLLPQLLAQCADRADALDARFARVLRIAVDPTRRRRGVGSALLAAVARDLDAEVEGLGASFGESDAALAFWRANGYTPFHRGSRPNPRSGRPSLAVLEARSARVAAVLGQAVAVHRDNEAARLGTSASASGARDQAFLARFARGERRLADTRAALLRLYRAEIAAPAPERLDDEALAALPAALGLGDVTGRRARERALRRWVGERLDAGFAPSQRVKT